MAANDAPRTKAEQMTAALRMSLPLEIAMSQKKAIRVCREKRGEVQNQPPVVAAVSPQSSVDPEAVVAPGTMELTLAKAQIRITGRVDAQVLRVVLECLRG